MKQAVICLFMALSLLVAPVAHAAGLVCAGEAKTREELLTGHEATSESGKKSDDVSKQCAHCLCCSHHLYDRVVLNAAEPVRKTAAIAILTDVGTLTSIPYGPPLEPPSHA